MSATIVTEGIRIASLTAGPPGRWRLTFESVHEGLHHQLYLDGRLADWTDSPSQRMLLVALGQAPRQATVVAVEAADRASDLGEQLPAELQSPSWLVRRRVRRTGDLPANAMALLLVTLDGQILELDRRPCWPPHVSREGLEQDPPGSDRGVIELAGAVSQEGLCQVQVAIESSGQQSTSPPQEQIAQPPPPCPQQIDILAYEPATQRLTLEVQ